MRIGLVCPYPWDVPGGVQYHVRDLAEELRARGHEVGVLSPVDDPDADLPDYLTPAGRAVPTPYNGSVSRLLFGPRASARSRRWLRETDYDVLHLHSPETISLSMLTLMVADGPIVATFHAATPRSRALAFFRPAVNQVLEKVQGRIAVSPAARSTVVSHLGGDAVVIPNGVSVATFRSATPLPGFPGPVGPGHGGTLGFLGRVDEPRKGFDVLVRAYARLARQRPGVRLLVAGPGEGKALADLPDDLRASVTMLGRLSESDKARFLRSVDVYVAPNTHGESFGIILLEALAAHAPVLAADLDAFTLVLADGRAGMLFPNGDDEALARAAGTLLEDATLRERLRTAGDVAVRPYDWSVVTSQVEQVYETVIAGVSMAEALRGPG